jgi:hypothetical protein
MLGTPPEIYKEWNGFPGSVRQPLPSNATSSSHGPSLLKSIYGLSEIPGFGPQYGTPQKSGTVVGQGSTANMRIAISNGYDDMMRRGDEDLERVYAESLRRSKGVEIGSSRSVGMITFA